MSGDWHTCCVHIMSGLVQRLQDALQQTIPAAQTAVPHLVSRASRGTHRGLPRRTLQVVPLAQRTVAQPSILSAPSWRASRASESTGLAEAPRARARNMRRRETIVTRCRMKGGVLWLPNHESWFVTGAWKSRQI